MIPPTAPKGLINNLLSRTHSSFSVVPFCIMFLTIDLLM